MNADALREWWWPTFGLLAVESAVVIGCAALGSRFVQSALWRRMIWQGCVVTLLACLTVECTGTARALLVRFTTSSAVILPPAPVASPAKPVPGRSLEGRFGDIPLFHPPPPNGEPSLARNRPPPSPSDVAGFLAAQSLPLVSTPEPGAGVSGRTVSLHLFAGAILVWALGVVLLLARSILTRLMLGWVRRQSAPVHASQPWEQLGVLRARLGVRRRIGLFESERLSSPVACGLFRPAIGLPRDFARNQDARRQEVMLMHELAHLEAGDPSWYWVADVAVALWWWQPLAWWMRRRLHAESEAAADEASLLVADGPGLLAECLVELGQQLATRRPSGWLGVDGGNFRSGLGRRVARLLSLEARTWKPPGLLGSILARTVAPVGLLAVVVLATAWTIPETSTEGDRMKNPLWSKPMTALALAWAVGTPTTNALAADTNLLIRPTATASAFTGTGLASTGGRDAVGSNGAGPGGGGGQRAQAFPARDAGRTGTVASSEGKGAAKLKAKLEAIVIDEVTYDHLPLGAVIQSLMSEAARRDPTKTGINFLLSKAAETPPGTVDSSTGLPLKAPEPFELALVSICIQPTLKSVRMIDVLDAITRVAERPIKYSIEEYAVVWTALNERPVAIVPAPAVPPALPQVRAFKLETNVFLKSLEKVFNVRAEGNADEIREVLWKNVFPKVGLHLNSETSAIFYNEVTGVLLVRATPSDLAIIQAAVETLGGKPTAGETASVPIQR